MSNTINIKNRKAAFEFFLMEEFTAGIQLTGTEIKSIRAGKASITEAYCTFIGNELFVRNMHVAEYTMGSYNNHEPKRDRKLVLTRRELRKIFNKITERGLTIIPSLLYIDEKGLAKLTIVIAKGKKLYDKRETLKHKDQQRDIDRETNK